MKTPKISNKEYKKLQEYYKKKSLKELLYDVMALSESYGRGGNDKQATDNFFSLRSLVHITIEEKFDDLSTIIGKGDR